ncbi:MAG: hypothetical protein MK180_01255 [Rhodobacteraceae bacterium]|nr:hypothetical protein [Paracoccaceae bacterium]
MKQFRERGWLRFEDAALAAWVQHALPLAKEIASDDAAKTAWLRHGGTWFAGVNILPNTATGALPGGEAISGQAAEIASEMHGGEVRWDAGQLSVVYPGYPQQDPTDTDAAHRFRKNRDAAHVDGLLPVGPDRRRMMQEPHGFVLGIPLTPCNASVSPMVVWEGSHEIIREAFQNALAGVAREAWSETDLTDVYQAARRRCFKECPRVPIHAMPGQGYFLHRLALHGVAPWGEDAEAPPEGRMIAYFRPGFNGSDWLNAP